MENFQPEKDDVVFNTKTNLFEPREIGSQSPPPNPPPQIRWPTIQAPPPPPISPVFQPEQKTPSPPISPVFQPENPSPQISPVFPSEQTKFPFPPKPPIILKPSTSNHPSTPTTPLVLETQEITPKFPPTFSPEPGIEPTQCFIPDSQPSSPSTQELFEQYRGSM